MAVYYKFKSARDYDSIPMDGPFISVGILKEKVFESKHLGKGKDFDLVVTNAQTNEEYLDEAMLIPKNTSVLIRRVPGRPRMPIVTEPETKVESKVEEAIPEKRNFTGADSSAMKYTEDNEWDEFGNDLYAIPEATLVQPSNPPADVTPTDRVDEDSKIKALIDTPALDWQRQGGDGFGPGRGFGRVMGGRMGGRGFGLERKTPPPGYVCHRCKVPGHFIQHCPTNGDPNYDIKRVKPPTGIPKSMLMPTPDGSYALPSGVVAVLKPNEAAFEKEIEGLPSTRSVGDLPPELHCPLCKEVMKDAVLTSKCCFKSFCDKCIRDYIITKSVCVCGAANILADDLLPNKTLRDAINRILESGNSSAENAGSTLLVQVPDMESARCPPPKIPSPTMSAASKEEQKLAPANEEATNLNMNDAADEVKPAIAPQNASDKMKAARVADISEATLESASVKEPASQGSAPLVDEEVQQKLVPVDAGKKKKNKKVRMPPNDLWKGPQDLAAENYMMPMAPPAFDPYWNGMQPGMEGFMAPYAAPPMSFMGYALGPLDMPFGSVIPPGPFGPQNFMMPVVPPQRDLAFGMGMNPVRPAMSREEFEARKADLRRRREIERRELPRDRELGREVNSAGVAASMKSAQRSVQQPPNGAPHYHQRPERPSPDRTSHELEPLIRPSKRKSEHHHHDYDHGDHSRDKEIDYHDQKRSDRHKDQGYDYREDDRKAHDHRHRRSESYSKAPAETASKRQPDTTTAADSKSKASVFSRISYPEEEAAAKKRKITSSGEVAAAGGTSASSAHHKSSSANGYYDDHKSSSAKMVSSSTGGGGRRSSSATLDYASSDDDHHFKRKSSRYEPSPPPPEEWEEDIKHSKGSKEREKDRSSRHK